MTTHPLARAASTALNSAATAAALAAAGTAMLLTDRALPATWTRAPRLLACGAVGVVAAVTADGLADIAVAPARKRLNATIYTSSEIREEQPQPSGPRPAADLEELATQLTWAAEDDAAVRAARAAQSGLDKSGFDHGDGFLGHADRWAGRPNGEATFFLAPGLVLHRAPTADPYAPGVFTLLSSAADQPVEITGMAQLLLQVEAHAAGLPAAEPRPAVAEAGRARPARVPVSAAAAS